MTEKSLSERIGILEARHEHIQEKVEGIIASRATRAAREWAVILAGLGLVGTVLAKNLGFM